MERHRYVAMTKDQATPFSNKSRGVDLSPSNNPEGIPDLSMHQPLETCSFANLFDTLYTSHGGPKKEMDAPYYMSLITLSL